MLSVRVVRECVLIGRWEEPGELSSEGNVLGRSYHLSARFFSVGVALVDPLNIFVRAIRRIASCKICPDDNRGRYDDKNGLKQGRHPSKSFRADHPETP
ncbi:hypothetical protein NPIL_260491 [Nephila pilipes]|uniref:Uncharacterized protein n=1 Tax=Nephila pilipes TaxID=299642 RepID=A0A8X6PD00_NEPPI|nr:hypothetical protein NPIL_260491 [Nephila pilipes]